MSDLTYQTVYEFTRNEITRELFSGDPDRISASLYSACRYDDDWKWVQDTCLGFIGSPHSAVRIAAVTCLGDLAFFMRRPIEAEVVLSALMEATSDRAIADQARFSISLINQSFMPQ